MVTQVRARSQSREVVSHMPLVPGRSLRRFCKTQLTRCMRCRSTAGYVRDDYISPAIEVWNPRKLKIRPRQARDAPRQATGGARRAQFYPDRRPKQAQGPPKTGHNVSKQAQDSRRQAHAGSADRMKT